MTFKPGNSNTTLRVDDRKYAGQLINQWARTARPGRPEQLAELGGQLVTGTVRTDAHMSGREIVLTLHGLPSDPARTTIDHANENPLGPIRQLEHRVNDLEQLHARLQNQAEHAREEHDRATEALRKPFKHADDLVAARDHLTQITAQMRGRETAQTQARDTTPEPPTPTPRLSTSLEASSCLGRVASVHARPADALVSVASSAAAALDWNQPHVRCSPWRSPTSTS